MKIHGRKRHQETGYISPLPVPVKSHILLPRCPDRLPHDIGLENDVVVSPTVIPFDEFEEYKQTLPFYMNIRNILPVQFHQLEPQPRRPHIHGRILLRRLLIGGKLLPSIAVWRMWSSSPRQ